MWEHEDWRIDTNHWPGPRYTFDEWMEINELWLASEFRSQVAILDGILSKMMKQYSVFVADAGDSHLHIPLIQNEVTELTPADRLKARSTGPVKPPSWQQRKRR